MDDEHSYLNGKLLFELSVFMRDLSAANETLSNHGFSITFCSKKLMMICLCLFKTNCVLFALRIMRMVPWNVLTRLETFMFR